MDRPVDEVFYVVGNRVQNFDSLTFSTSLIYVNIFITCLSKSFLGNLMYFYQEIEKSTIGVLLRFQLNKSLAISDLYKFSGWNIWSVAYKGLLF